MDRLHQLLCAVIPVRVASLRVGLRTERGSIFITLSLAEPGLDVKYCQVHTLGDLWGPGGAGEITGSVSASEA